jgi:hypothetical protein
MPLNGPNQVFGTLPRRTCKEQEKHRKARLVPITEKALRLQGAGIRDPLAHHVRLIKKALREADQFDILHFHLDHLHFPLVRRTQSFCATTLHGRLDIPDRQSRGLPVRKFANDCILF